MKKLSVILLCIVLCLCIGCSKSESTVMSYKGMDAPESLYSYWMSTYKTEFLYSFNSGIDSDEFWDSLISDDQTYEQYITEWVNNEMKYRTVALKLFAEYRLKLSDEKVAAIDADIAEKIDYAGSREALNNELAEMGMNIDMLRSVYIANAKYDAVYEYLYGTEGINAPSATDKAQYYNDNYYCLKYITVYSGAMLATDDNGNYIYDDDGNIELIKLTDEQKATKQQLIDTIVAGVEAGGDFDEYIKEFSEVDYSDYPNGFFVSTNDYSRFGSDIINAALELEVGGIRTVNDENVTYIIKKCELPQYSSLGTTDLSQLEKMEEALVRELFTAEFDEYAKDVTVNSEITEKYPIRKVSENSYF